MVHLLLKNAPLFAPLNARAAEWLPPQPSPNRLSAAATFDRQLGLRMLPGSLAVPASPFMMVATRRTLHFVSCCLPVSSRLFPKPLRILPRSLAASASRSAAP